MLTELGSAFNGRGKRRTTRFNTDPSRLFYNEIQSTRNIVWSNLQFAVERFQDKAGFDKLLSNIFFFDWNNRLKPAKGCPCEQNLSTLTKENPRRVPIWHWLPNESTAISNNLSKYSRVEQKFVSGSFLTIREHVLKNNQMQLIYVSKCETNIFIICLVND